MFYKESEAKSRKVVTEMKKINVGLILICTFLFMVRTTVYSQSERDFSEMQSCRYLYSENNSYGAFIYGYNINTLYSARVLPKSEVLSKEVNGKIRSVCHDGENSYALFERTISNYSVLKIDNTKNTCDFYDFDSMKMLNNDYFAVTDNKVYFINTDNVYSYITSYELSGRKLRDYYFNNEIVKLFLNDSDVYVLLYDGNIYRLNSDNYEYCVTVNPEYEISNAGSGCIYSEEGCLVSLEKSSTFNLENINAESVVVSNSEVYYAIGNTVYCKNTDDTLKKFAINSNIIKLFVYDNRVMAIDEDFIGTTINKSDLKGDSFQSYTQQPNTNFNLNSDNIYYRIESGTTIAEFKETIDSTVVYDHDGYIISSGKIKSGYSVYVDGKIRYLSVRGDITGEGNVNSRDVSALMSYFTKKSQFDKIQLISADYNFDGSVDNKDLILVSRKHKSSE